MDSGAYSGSSRFCSSHKIRGMLIPSVAIGRKGGNAISCGTVTANPETDFSKMSLDEVALFGLRARHLADSAREQHLRQAGQACAYLHANGWKWKRIGQSMGVNLATAYRWAKPYLPQ